YSAATSFVVAFTVASSTWSFPAVALITATWAVGDGAVVGPGAASLPPRCVITNPVRTAIAATPTTDARKTDLVFIASIMHQVVSAVTMLPKEPGKARLKGSLSTKKLAPAYGISSTRPKAPRPS